MSEATKQSNAPDVTSDTTSGMGVTSQVFVGVTKPVDSLTLAGSTPGDHREKESADFSTDQFKNQAGPRGETGTKGA